MNLSTSYNQILKISLPIMLGSAAQNVIALSDSVFLYHRSEEDFGVIGFVGVFYLVIAAIGFGFSKGGQIIIARRMGESRPAEVGRSFYAMLYFELALAMLMFAFMQFGSYYFFQWFVDSDIVLYKSMEYLKYRSWGVFFSYTGVAIIALYTGIARPIFIIVDTVILALVNIFLNYTLIFGHWGFPEMGIGGAGLASTIAEIVAFVVFVVYIWFDKKAKPFKLFSPPPFDFRSVAQVIRDEKLAVDSEAVVTKKKRLPITFPLIQNQYTLGAPIVAQAVVGLGSWFVFFGIVENMGERELAITNLVRMVYLVLSIPCWGFASGVNTLVSNFIGANKRQAVLPIIWKTAKICFASTMLITIPFVLFPQQILYPLLGGSDMSLIIDAQPVLYVLVGILMLFSVGGVYFNGLAGTGATMFGLKVQFWCAVGYLVYIYFVIEVFEAGLAWAWASEIFYWAAMLAVTVWFLRRRTWYSLRV